jgi:hypothetical protein
MAFYNRGGADAYSFGGNDPASDSDESQAGGYYEYFGGDGETDSEVDEKIVMPGGYYGGKTSDTDGVRRTFKIVWSDVRQESHRSSRYVSVDPISAAKKVGSMLWRYADKKKSSSNLSTIKFVIQETTQKVPKDKRKSRSYTVARKRLGKPTVVTRFGKKIEYKWRYEVSPCMRHSSM